MANGECNNTTSRRENIWATRVRSVCLGIRCIVSTSKEDGPLGLVEEDATSADNDWLVINFDSVFVFGDGELHGDATGGEAPIPDQDECDQQDSGNQSYRECGARVECVEGKNREEATRYRCWDARSAYGLSGFDNKA